MKLLTDLKSSYKCEQQILKCAIIFNTIIEPFARILMNLTGST